MIFIFYIVTLSPWTGKPQNMINASLKQNINVTDTLKQDINAVETLKQIINAVETLKHNTNALQLTERIMDVTETDETSGLTTDFENVTQFQYSSAGKSFSESGTEKSDKENDVYGKRKSFAGVNPTTKCTQ